MSTKIEWCHETWNPITGCSPISEGCKNCYARRMAQRLKGRYGYPKDEPFKVTFHPDRLDQPLKWKKPRLIFVCSMGDLFHDDVIINWPWLDAVLSRMIDYDRHKYLVLTKRPKNMKSIMFDVLDGIGIERMEKIPFWLGVTAENQKRADERISILLQIPAAVRFVSVEPMLEPISLRKYLQPDCMDMCPIENNCEECIPSFQRKFTQGNYLDWVIAGPETGPGKREYKPEWIKSLHRQCWDGNIPFFDKTKKNWLAREFPKSKTT